MHVLAIFAAAIILMDATAMAFLFDPPSQCATGCPVGWNTLGGLSKNCYLMPAQPLKVDTMRNQLSYCQNQDADSYPVVINDVLEQGLLSVVVLQYKDTWIAQLGMPFVWLGAYVDPTGRWVFLDNSDQSQNLLMLPQNVVNLRTNDTCLGADPKTVGVWLARPCSDLNGVAICETPKRQICGARGGDLPVSTIDLKNAVNLIPNAASLPGFGNLFSLFGGGGVLGF